MAKDSTFSHRDVIRIYEKNLDLDESIKVEEYFAELLGNFNPEDIGFTPREWEALKTTDKWLSGPTGLIMLLHLLTELETLMGIVRTHFELDKAAKNLDEAQHQVQVWESNLYTIVNLVPKHLVPGILGAMGDIRSAFTLVRRVLSVVELFLELHDLIDEGRREVTRQERTHFPIWTARVNLQFPVIPDEFPTT